MSFLGLVICCFSYEMIKRHTNIIKYNKKLLAFKKCQVRNCHKQNVKKTKQKIHPFPFCQWQSYPLLTYDFES